MNGHFCSFLLNAVNVYSMCVEKVHADCSGLLSLEAEMPRISHPAFGTSYLTEKGVRRVRVMFVTSVRTLISQPSNQKTYKILTNMIRAN